MKRGTEKPKNGFAGLKYWKNDITAGLVVSLISLPFSLGIAVASGAPPITGIISAIIAGLVLPFLGGSYVTISGPAAGLAPALLAAMLLLGKGDREIGYPLLLVAICLTGVVQIILAKFKLARYADIFPAGVVKGMLGAIGLLIIVKQIPLILGREFQGHGFWEILAEIPSQLPLAEPTVVFVGLSSLALLIGLSRFKKSAWLRVVPPQVFAAVYGLLFVIVVGLPSQYLINVPSNAFEHGITFPHFTAFIDSSLWWPLFTTVIVLTLIDGVESLATINAIDKIDPYQRKSDPNRTLFAMGVSNALSSLAGGLTIIPGGVKSTACIMAGGKTQWANFWNAIFLIVYLLFATAVINRLPLAALGAIVIFTGYKLCAPKIWKEVAHIGTEQLLVFCVTVVVTVSTDLLIGIIAGCVVEMILIGLFHLNAVREISGNPLAPSMTFLTTVKSIFSCPMEKMECHEGTCHVYWSGPIVCFNRVETVLEQIPATTTTVHFHYDSRTTIVDHTSMLKLQHLAAELEARGGAVVLHGHEQLCKRGAHRSATRILVPAISVVD